MLNLIRSLKVLKDNFYDPSTFEPSWISSCILQCCDDEPHYLCCMKVIQHLKIQNQDWSLVYFLNNWGSTDSSLFLPLFLLNYWSNFIFFSFCTEPRHISNSKFCFSSQHLTCCRQPYIHIHTYLYFILRTVFSHDHADQFYFVLVYIYL